MHIRALSKLECTDLLSAARLARLACTRNGRPYVVSIHFAFANDCLYAFSMPGQMIESMRENPEVCLLIEEEGPGRAWKSVMVDGRFEELPDRIRYKVERERAASLLGKHSHWWEPGALKLVTPRVSDNLDYVFFRIVVEQLSGREAIEA